MSLYQSRRHQLSFCIDNAILPDFTGRTRDAEAAEIFRADRNRSPLADEFPDNRMGSACAIITAGFASQTCADQKRCFHNSTALTNQGQRTAPCSRHAPLSSDTNIMRNATSRRGCHFAVLAALQISLIPQKQRPPAPKPGLHGKQFPRFSRHGCSTHGLFSIPLPHRRCLRL